MNKYQRIVLIAVGVLIAVIQLVGISDHGLDDSKGWAISFLISAILLFIGFGSWEGVIAAIFQRGQAKPDVEQKTQSFSNTPDRPIKTNKAETEKQVNKHDYGIHISEMDIAIEAHKNYAENQKIFVPLSGNGKSINWNCCVSVYASMRYAARKAEMRISGMIWNTIIHSMVVRMATQEIKGIGMGDPGYQELENEAYQNLELLDKKVEEALDGKGKYAIEPIVTQLIFMFGGHQDSNALKALSALVLINAEKAHQKIIPELLQDLS